MNTIDEKSFKTLTKVNYIILLDLQLNIALVLQFPNLPKQ